MIILTSHNFKEEAQWCTVAQWCNIRLTSKLLIGRREGKLVVEGLVSVLSPHVSLTKSLCSISSLSTQMFEWVAVNIRGNLTECFGRPCGRLASCPGEGRWLSVCHATEMGFKHEHL